MNDEELEELRRLVEEERQRNEEEKKRQYSLRQASLARYRQTPKGIARSQRRQRMTEEQKVEERAKWRAWYAENRERVADYYKERKRKIQESAAGRPRPDTCEICGRGGKIVFDHCHSSNKFRGWLCDQCNIALGLLNDDADLLEMLAEYIRSHE